MDREEPSELQSMRSQRVGHDWLSMHRMQATNQMVTGEAKESEVGKTRGTVVSSCIWGKAVENLFSFENITPMSTSQNISVLMNSNWDVQRLQE